MADLEQENVAGRERETVENKEDQNTSDHILKQHGDGSEHDSETERGQSQMLSSRSQKKRKGKTHRGPPSPTPEEIEQKEKEFILDCIAVDKICKDYSHSQPKLGPAIPAYNSQKDKHVKAYFGRSGVSTTLEKTEQGNGGSSIDGPVIDRFLESGAGYRYLHTRNEAPTAAKAGHSKEQVNGHGQFMSEAKPNFGYHGQFGYRRNTPWLRKKPSPFGEDTRSPLH